MVRLCCSYVTFGVFNLTCRFIYSFSFNYSTSKVSSISKCRVKHVSLLEANIV